MMHRAAIALLAAGLSATPAMADLLRPDGTTIDCYCTDTQGDRVELGEVICLHVGGRSFNAQCQMSLNNPMWRELNEGCLSSALDPEPGPAPPMSPAPDRAG